MAIAVLGMGKTGISLAKYFFKSGKEVWGIDDRSTLGSTETHAREVTSRLFLGGTLPPMDQVREFFISPGVDPGHPAARAAVSRGLVLSGELDLAYSLCRGEILAITGTNGKSTTTALLGEMLKNDEKKTAVGGNLGTPFLDLLFDGMPYSHFVIEVSSFQLETVRAFRPKVAALLNLSDDHFDRHPNLAEYLKAKRRIFSFQGPGDFAVYNHDDLHVLEAVEGIASKAVPFSTAKKVAGAHGNESAVYWSPEGKILSSFDLSKCSLQGLHNLENICAAVACAKLISVKDKAIQGTIDTFQGLPHRIEWVRKINGVDYYDDSKATNVGAVVMSLAGFDESVILIMGGKDKGGDYSPLKPLLKAKVRALILLGEAKEKIMSTLSGATETFEVSDMKQAVERAHELAPPGGTVLLSPACSSFDMYADYKELGEDFKKWVRTLCE
jgi:UDP-N-acetylmuramoylalanine--D-glutamate ligase